MRGAAPVQPGFGRASGSMESVAAVSTEGAFPCKVRAWIRAQRPGGPAADTEAVSRAEMTWFLYKLPRYGQ